MATGLQQLYEEVAKRRNLTKYQVEDIFRSQFSLVVEVFSIAKKFRKEVSIRLPSMGSFVPRHNFERFFKDEGKPTSK